MPPILANIGEFWRRTSMIQRIILLGVLLACVGAAVLLLGWAQRPEMVLLYGELEEQEAARIAGKIRDAGVACELRAGGTAVYVAHAAKDEMRITMAAEGLPSGGQAGWKLLEQDQIGASPFLQRVKYLRALEGEIAASIRTLEGVTGARVHVVLPERNVFAAEQKQAKASVALKLRPGWRMSASRVAAIVHLVSGSVPDLPPENVEVVDAAGTLYTAGGEDQFGQAGGGVLSAKAQAEQDLAEEVEQMLTRVLGPGRVSVCVSVEMETEHVQQTSTTYSPDGKVIRRERIEKKDTTAPAAAAGATGSSGKESVTETDYELSKETSVTTKVPGKILSKAVAVCVDLTPPKAEGEEAGAEAAPAKMPAVEDVQRLVTASLGLDLQGGDTLEVVDTPFHKDATAAATFEDDSGSMAFWLEVARRSSLGVLVIGALLALRMFRGPKRKVESGASAPALEGASGAAAGALPGGGAPGLARTRDAEALRSQITSALQENPDEVKRLFLSWVQNETGEG